MTRVINVMLNFLNHERQMFPLSEWKKVQKQGFQKFKERGNGNTHTHIKRWTRDINNLTQTIRQKKTEVDQYACVTDFCEIFPPFVLFHNIIVFFFTIALYFL